MRRVAKGDQFVIVACDGLWDEMSSCQVHGPEIQLKVIVRYDRHFSHQFYLTSGGAHSSRIDRPTWTLEQYRTKAHRLLPV